MKPKLLFVFLLLGAPSFAQTFQVDTANAQPWWEQVDQIQALLLKWITMLSIVFAALGAAVFGAVVWIKSKLRELRQRTDEKMDALDKRQDRLVDEKRDLQRQITDVAIATDPTKTSSGRPAQVEIINRPSQPVPTIEKKP